MTRTRAELAHGIRDNHKSGRVSDFLIERVPLGALFPSSRHISLSMRTRLLPASLIASKAFASSLVNPDS